MTNLKNQNPNTASESEKYSFYRIPKALSTEPRYSGLSLEAKFLYGLLLDRMSLSAQNGWTDPAGRVYIYFRLEEVMAQIHCGHTKAGKLFMELERSELIERKKQGLGKPARIYVNYPTFNQAPAQTFSERPCAPIKPQRDETFSMPKYPSAPVPACEPSPEEWPAPVPQEDSIVQQMPDYDVPDPVPEECWNQSAPEYPPEIHAPSLGAGFREPEVMTSQIGQYGLHSSSGPDFRFPEVNYIRKNKTEKNYTEYSIYPYPSACSTKERIWMDEMERYKARLRENIEYDRLLEEYPFSAETLDGYVDMMAEACCNRRDFTSIAGNNLPTGAVKSHFLKLNYEHIVYVLDCMKENTTFIHNIKAYTLAALYNAPLTMQAYYAARVNHDLYGNAS